MKTTAELEVGDTVLYYSQMQRNSGPVEKKISRVGTKNVYIEVNGREAGFNKQTGIETRSYTGVADIIRTPEQRDYYDERRELILSLKENGLERDGYGDWNLTNDQLKRILSIAEE